MQSTSLNSTVIVVILDKLSVTKIKTRTKEHVPKSIISHIIDKKGKKIVAIKNAMKESAIA